MIEIGKINKLEVKDVVDLGLYLDAKEFGMMLLPAEEVQGNYKKGDWIEVFLYSDNNDQMTVTLRWPMGYVGEFAYLKVVDVASVGTFLDWGMPKDLFVPFSEQIEKMVLGESYVVKIFYDEERERIAASSDLEKFIDTENMAYSENDPVDLLICEQTALGYNAIINNQHMGLLYAGEVFQELSVGQKVKGYIKKMREDQKIDLCLDKQGYQKPDDLSEKILAYMKANGGVSKITDKSDSDLIADTFGVSKKKYKMAVGLLYKERKITIDQGQLRVA